ncbi:tetratricopeptide repeat protein, partial [Actinomadura sp. CNU-125]|uniref:tetratricopeptide repeat protein n=1 Tax=Actinomadura sp. CNU-125 TaxID=1904961 RepID=UPI000A81FB08
MHPGRTFGRAACAALTGVPVAEAAESLEALADANLLDDVPGGRYRFHELTRLHALELVETREPPAARAAALAGLARWTAAAALAVSAAAAPYRRLPDPPDEPGAPGPPRFPSVQEAVDWLDAEFPNLRAVARRAHEAGHHREALLIVDAAWPLFLQRGHRDDRLDFDATGLTAARAAGDRAAEAKMLNRTGLARRDLDRPDEAARDFRAARDIWRELGDRARQGGSERRLGLLELDRGDTGAARRHFRAALGVYRAEDDARKIALSLCDLAVALLEDGRRDAAAEPLAEARDLLADQDDAYNRDVRVLLGAPGRAPPTPRPWRTAGWTPCGPSARRSVRAARCAPSANTRARDGRADA